MFEETHLQPRLAQSSNVGHFREKQVLRTVEIYEEHSYLLCHTFFPPWCDLKSGEVGCVFFFFFADLRLNFFESR